MNVKSITPIISTPKLEEVKAFYTQHLKFKVVYDGEWYLSMHAPESKEIAIDFTRPNIKEIAEPIFHTVYEGKGAFIALEVEDVDKEWQRLKLAGISLESEPRDEPWGQRHFALVDPCGLAIDIFKWIPATEDYAKDCVA
ncbi:MAG: VOC family protein [Cyanobacteria bacterium P01_E01_bin.34]